MAENIYRKLIIKELKGETSPDESQKIDQWINESPENLKIFNELWSAFELTSPDVNSFNTDKEVAWSKIYNKISIPLVSRSKVIQFSRIAAAAVIFFLVGIAVQYFRTEKFPVDFLNQYSTVILK